MRWKYETYKQRETRLSKWHIWFAWYPVRYDGTAYWLECVERKAIFTHIHGYEYYEYKSLK